MNPPRIERGAPLPLERAVMELLPETGSVEVQRDTPHREHPTHRHATDETLLVLDGEITFAWNGEQSTCSPGDRLLLPAGTVHSSVAGERGCLYLIAMRMVADERTG